MRRKYAMTYQGEFVDEGALETSVMEKTKPPVWAYCCIVLAASALAVVVGFPGGSQSSDSQWYRMLAEGRPETVVQPFASRQLGPRLVRALTRLAPISTDRGFEAVTLVSTFVCLAGIGYLLYCAHVPASMFAATAFLPVWANFAHGYMLPEALFNALFVLLLICLWRRSYGLAVLILVPMYMARESTLLVLLCFLVAGIRYVRPGVLAGAIAASSSGAYVGHYLARNCQPNIHHLPAALYLLGKIPFNFMENIVGFQIWLNTMNAKESPLWSWQAPRWLPLGAIRIIGINHFHSYFPSWTLLGWMGGFGILPIFLFFAWRSGELRLAWDNFFLRFCLLVGVLSFMIGPLLGASTFRLTLYGWPAFLVALPMIYPNGAQNRRGLMLTNQLCGWMPYLAGILQNPSGDEPAQFRFIALAIVAGCWIFILTKLLPPRLSSLPLPVRHEVLRRD